jgi:hypothetical protein
MVEHRVDGCAGCIGLLECPRHAPPSEAERRASAMGATCPACNGAGGMRGYSAGSGCDVDADCGVCDGAGCV